MTRYRQFMKYGNTDVIKLKPTDKVDLNMKYGDMIDIEDAVKKTSISKDLKKRLKLK